MDFKQLRSFIAVVRYGSFTTAATKLRISQPTVSTHVRQLEEEVGAELVMRNAKHVELTSEGYKVYDQAASMLAMHDKLLQSIRRKGDTSVYLGASSIPSGYILPGLLTSFCAQHPELRFVVTQDSSQPIINGMLSGLYELGFVGTNVKEDALDCVPFYSDRIVVVMPNMERFAQVDSNDRDAVIRMLRTEPVIVRKGGSATRSASGRILSKIGVGEASLRTIATLNDQEAIKSLVENGCGIAMLSELAVRDRVAAGRLLAIDIPGVDASRQFYIVKRRNAMLNDLAQAFFDFVLAQAETPSA